MSLKGGRGLKAPYDTKVIRVPEPLLSQINQLVNDYHDSCYEPILRALRVYSIKDTHIQKAKQILRKKKSARLSLLELLAFIHSDDSITFDD